MQPLLKTRIPFRILLVLVPIIVAVLNDALAKHHLKSAIQSIIIIIGITYLITLQKDLKVFIFYEDFFIVKYPLSLMYWKQEIRYSDVQKVEVLPGGRRMLPILRLYMNNGKRIIFSIMCFSKDEKRMRQILEEKIADFAILS